MTRARVAVTILVAAGLATFATIAARADEPQPFHLVRSDEAPALVVVEAPPVAVHVGEAVVKVEHSPAVATIERHTTVAVGDVDDGGGVVIHNSGAATASTGGNIVSGGGSVVTGPATAVANRSTVSIGR
jgi:hypothetical protein